MRTTTTRGCRSSVLCIVVTDGAHNRMHSIPLSRCTDQATRTWNLRGDCKRHSVIIHSPRSANTRSKRRLPPRADSASVRACGGS